MEPEPSVLPLYYPFRGRDRHQLRSVCTSNSVAEPSGLPVIKNRHDMSIHGAAKVRGRGIVEFVEVFAIESQSDVPLIPIMIKRPVGSTLRTTDMAPFRKVIGGNLRRRSAARKSKVPRLTGLIC